MLNELNEKLMRQREDIRRREGFVHAPPERIDVRRYLPEARGSGAEAFDTLLKRMRQHEQNPARRDAVKAFREADERRASARVIERLSDRGIPRHEGTRKVAVTPRIPCTAAVASMIAALRWCYTQSPVPGARRGAVVILAGDVGCGKSAGGAWFIAHLPVPALFITADEVAGIPNNDWSSHQIARERLREIEVLFIDEAGLEGSERAGPRIASILHRRYDRGLLTVVATNLDLASFRDRYFELADARGERFSGSNRPLISRLQNEQEGAGKLPWWYELHPADYRLPENAARLAKAPLTPDLAAVLRGG